MEDKILEALSNIIREIDERLIVSLPEVKEHLEELKDQIEWNSWPDDNT